MTGAGERETAVAGTGVPQPAGLTGVGAELQAGAPATAAIDAHPLVREYLGLRLRESHPGAWREGHRRLYAFLKQSVPQHPEGPAGLQPLYQAVAHGCLAGSQQEACAEVYRDRILRGTGDDGFYSWRKLGAFGANLGALACFFDEPWQRVCAALAEPDRAWLLSEAAFCLRALGRLTEALEPMRAGLAMRVRQEDWKNAAISAGNQSALGLTLGLVSDALADGERSVDYADRSGDAFQRMGKRTTVADALHQQGQRGPALERFREAESMQAQRQPQYPLLYGLAGYWYCDLLLAGPERAAWRALPARWKRLQPRREAAEPQRAASRLKPLPPGLRDDLGDHASAGTWADAGGTILALADDHVDWADDGSPTPTRADAGAPLGQDPRPGLQQECEAVLERAKKMFEWRVPTDSLLTIALDHLTLARADLDEAWQIASRGGMRLLMADCRLHHARLLRDRAELAQARALIESCGYQRRREELQDAATAAADW